MSAGWSFSGVNTCPPSGAVSESPEGELTLPGVVCGVVVVGELIPPPVPGVTTVFSRAGSVAAGSSITTISPPIRGEIATVVDGDEPVTGGGGRCIVTVIVVMIIVVIVVMIATMIVTRGVLVSLVTRMGPAALATITF